MFSNTDISITDACPLCGAEDSWRHALLGYTMARCIWALSDEDLVEKMSDNPEPTTKNWVFALHQELSHEHFTRLVVTLWSIWYARHKAVYESIFQGPRQTDAFIKSFLHDLRTAEAPAK